MMTTTAQPQTLWDVLVRRAADEPGQRAYTFLVNGETEGVTWTWAELFQRSRHVAALLRDRVPPGERALLVYPPGLDFLAAFLGCSGSGIVAVPTAPPHPLRPTQSLTRLQAIVTEADVRAVLCTEAMAQRAPAWFRPVPCLAGLPLVATDGPVGQDSNPDITCQDWNPDPQPWPDSGGLAFLQYTSGSTASPRGVMVSHANLLHNLGYIQQRAALTPAEVGVSWLPAHHDMGLLAGLLLPLLVGFPSYLMAPTAFVQKPLRWLQAVSRYRATLSGGPNFAYDLCLKHVELGQRQGLDLGSWRTAFNGAEPIRRQTLANFAREFAAVGFRAGAFCPTYGLAEATLLVTNGLAPDLAGPNVEPTGVGCGLPGCGVEVQIVDPQRHTPAAPGILGEIWVAGPSVGQGYWNRPDDSARTFRAVLADGRGPFLRTGDLGFVRDGDLVVTGRIKDLIILRGRKLHPQDLERTAEASHPALRGNGVAAFSVSADGGERLAIVAEVAERRGAAPGLDPAEVVGAIRQALAADHEVQAHAVRLVAPGALPRTTSGKLQRHACRQRFLEGTLEPWGPRRPRSSRTARGQTVA
jgi:acyl-CoA synthetase (AMP-forming)/AMP-acid ligase II